MLNDSDYLGGLKKTHNQPSVSIFKRNNFFLMEMLKDN